MRGAMGWTLWDLRSKLTLPMVASMRPLPWMKIYKGAILLYQLEIICICTNRH